MALGGEDIWGAARAVQQTVVFIKQQEQILHGFAQKERFHSVFFGHHIDIVKRSIAASRPGVHLAGK